MDATPEIGAVGVAALQLQDFCEAEKWRFCFISGLAVLAWAHPRSTIDADITLLAGFGGEEPYVDRLLGRFPPRMPDAREFALRHRVLLLRSDNNIALDVGLGGLPFEENAIRRSVVKEVMEGCSLRVCSAEDLIVHKAFASRDQDWADVDSTLMRQGGNLDVRQILDELAPLIELKEEPEIMAKLKLLLRKRALL